jgi:riboflavin synthase
MFTGIVRAIGTIAHLEARGGDVRLVVGAGALDLADVAVGDSICVGGVCLTAVEIAGVTFAVDVSRETLSCTTMSLLRHGDFVNLEKSLAVSDRLGGHFVSGHVDGVGRVVSIEADARSQRWAFEVPSPLSRYIAAKGSVCVDGASLTVNGVAANRFDVNLIPHTIEATTFRHRRVGDRVNIEVDLIARYVERLAFPGDADGSPPSI